MSIIFSRQKGGGTVPSISSRVPIYKERQKPKRSSRGMSIHTKRVEERRRRDPHVWWGWERSGALHQYLISTWIFYALVPY
ncbi:Uncharacterized protein APZ42_014267 [Daphnia magna]|uniref:Uncharacterized protein n=1 Tax=Daphnia magna TaxID=35525 RepID=A0A162Q6B1_9CRUS|nr:Uncharacterized protein APZ42_014267 [Daphnia magna]